MRASTLQKGKLSLRHMMNESARRSMWRFVYVTGSCSFSVQEGIDSIKVKSENELWAGHLKKFRCDQEAFRTTVALLYMQFIWWHVPWLDTGESLQKHLRDKLLFSRILRAIALCLYLVLQAHTIPIVTIPNNQGFEKEFFSLLLRNLDDSTGFARDLGMANLDYSSTSLLRLPSACTEEAIKKPSQLK